jgi:hypothetical protein
LSPLIGRELIAKRDAEIVDSDLKSLPINKAK